MAKYQKGQKFHIEHNRKGDFYCVAVKDFNTETDEFYPLADLYDMAEFSCRATFCKLTPISDEEFERMNNNA